MKTFQHFLLEKEGKSNPAVLAFGRFNPPHSGHLKVIEKVHDVSKKHKAKHYVVLSHLQDARKNPLPQETKMGHAKKVFPNTNLIPADKQSPSIMQWAANLYKAGHTHLHIVAGQDRVKEYQQLLKKYNGEGKSFNFKSINVHSAGGRNPHSNDLNGLSASKMRGYAKLNKFDDFARGLPDHVSKATKKKIFDEVRENMGLNEEEDNKPYVALFVVGPAGSGKDYIVNKIMQEYNIEEFNFRQMLNCLDGTFDVKKHFIEEGRLILINGTALEFDVVHEIKEQLETRKYDTCMLFVNVTDEESKKRNLDRLNSGGRMIEEQVRREKWQLAQVNITGFYELFENFELVDNSQQYPKLDELFEKGWPFKYDNSTPIVKKTEKSKKKAKAIPLVGNKLNVNQGTGIGPTINSRAGGASAAAGGGIGDPLYREMMDFGDMPATGAGRGADMEPMVTPGAKFSRNSGPDEPSKKRKRLKDFRKK